MNSEQKCTTYPDFMKYKAVLLDVAGTTTSITFIKETLFKFALDRVDDFLKDEWENKEVQEAVKLLLQNDQEVELNVDNAKEKFKSLHKENSINIGFKTLQGLIYEKGYKDKTLKAHVFADVPKVLSIWSKDKTIAIYSTGSVHAQKLLFSNTIEGDLSAEISKYFDQSIVGNKLEAASYTKIAQELELEKDQILFISDSVDELKAAKQAGVLTVLVKRDEAENSVEDDKEFPTILSFDKLPLENSNKRKNDVVADADTNKAPPTKIPKTDNKAEISNETKDTVVEMKSPNKIESMETEEVPVENNKNSSENKETIHSKKEESIPAESAQDVENCQTESIDVSNLKTTETELDKTDGRDSKNVAEIKLENLDVEMTDEGTLKEKDVKEDANKIEKTEAACTDNSVTKELDQDNGKVTETIETNGTGKEVTDNKPVEVDVPKKLIEKVDELATKNDQIITETATEDSIALEKTENKIPLKEDAKTVEKEHSEAVTDVKGSAVEDVDKEIPASNLKTITKEEDINGKGTENEKHESDSTEDGKDVKIKKLEANTGSPAISVEV